METIIFIWFISIVIGVAVGIYKAKGWAAFCACLLLGPLGMLAVIFWFEPNIVKCSECSQITYNEKKNKCSSCGYHIYWG